MSHGLAPPSAARRAGGGGRSGLVYPAAPMAKASPRRASAIPFDPDRLDPKLPGLSARSVNTCLAAAEALLADVDDAGNIVPAPRELCERAVIAFDRSIGRGSKDLRRGFAVLTLALEIAPLLVIGAFSRMSRLPIDRRVAYLEALETSRIGLLSMLFVAFKVPLCIPAFEDGAELALTGFDRPTTVARRKLPAIQAAGS